MFMSDAEKNMSWYLKKNAKLKNVVILWPFMNICMLFVYYHGNIVYRPRIDA